MTTDTNYSIVLHRHRAVEAEVFTFRPLLLNRLVGGPLAVLKAEVHVRGGSDQDDSEPQMQLIVGALPQKDPRECVYQYL